MEPNFGTKKLEQMSYGKFIILFLQLNLLMLWGSVAFSQKIKSNSGQKLSWESLKKHEISLLLFFDPECPICQKYTKTIKFIDSVYHDKLGIYLLYPYSKLEANTWENFQTKYKFKYDLYLDRKRAFAKKTQANTTPEAILLDSKQDIIYKGAIDNWYYDLGKNRNKANEFYLIQAIESYLNRQEIKIKSSKAVGCIFSSV